MKTNLLLLNRTFLLGAAFSLSSLIGVSQNVTIPDAAFKNYLLKNVTINTNADAEIQTAEAAAFSDTIDVDNLAISNLTGIEAFTALTYLYCNYNKLTSLNVSANTALIGLYCHNNLLTSLNVSVNTALTYLYCYYNQLTSLNVSGATALTELDCGDNQLISLNVSANTVLTKLYCTNNLLTSLNVSANTALIVLYCYNNQLTSLNVSANTALAYLWCPYNQLTSLNVSANTALTRLNCSSNKLTSLNVSANKALTYLGCGSNQLKSLNVQNGNNVNFSGFRATNNPNLTCIQVDNVAWATANWRVADDEIDATASFSVNCISGIDEQNTSTFTIYPNPATTQLTLNTELQIMNCQLRIMNTTGQLVYQSAINNPQSTIDISSFASGIYFIQLATEQGITNKKFIKQ